MYKSILEYAHGSLWEKQYGIRLTNTVHIRGGFREKIVYIQILSKLFMFIFISCYPSSSIHIHPFVYLNLFITMSVYLSLSLLTCVYIISANHLISMFNIHPSVQLDLSTDRDLLSHRWYTQPSLSSHPLRFSFTHAHKRLFLIYNRHPYILAVKKFNWECETVLQDILL